ncbi:hypothetical protein ZWY2020_016976 [Hordeum vulgare]|nr:hypothetical protein ZWY2020_016976 [Hordeum vulgare]
MEVASVVAELVGLITNIFQTVETVSVNKKECKELAGCLCTIRWVLAILPEDPEVRPPLEQLKNTLHQADEMIVACENSLPPGTGSGPTKSSSQSQSSRRNEISHGAIAGLQLRIEDVTSNFTNKLDGGCSALVFKGRLDDAPEPEVAVKVLNSARGGWCCWACPASHYLHHGAAPQPVIHRNVTSSNILLDASWNPRLSGFGSAVLLAAGEEQGGQLVGDGEFVGTFGYIDPEYKLTMKASPASDVYSFGVVILEALTGSPLAKKGKPLVDSALPAIQNNRNLRSALDKHLPSTPQQLKALELVADTASCCLRPYGNARPTMSAVVANFERALSFISA